LRRSRRSSSSRFSSSSSSKSLFWKNPAEECYTTNTSISSHEPSPTHTRSL
jgi:hypothetical protein